MRILVGLSGGVDSAYAAHRLKEEGHEVVGATLLMHDYTDTESARKVADAVGIPFCRIDCRGAFDEVVRSYFVKEYSRGRTPNPCIVCNRGVKFRLLADHAREHGFDAIATGHYARVVTRRFGDTVRYAFGRAQDDKKDQTYMLYRLPQDVISMLVLPLADLDKRTVKAAAAKLGIVAEGVKESQEICFIPDGDYASYIENTIGELPDGDFVDAEGNVLGRHKGIVRYTIGQRKGLGISLGYRAFVSNIDVENNTVTLAREGVYNDRVELEDMIYSGISEPIQSEQRRVLVKLRYAASPLPATAILHPDGTAQLKLDSPGRSVTPGQSAVLYEEDTVIAGGFIV